MNILGSRQVISGKLAQDVADRDAELGRLHDRGDERAQLSDLGALSYDYGAGQPSDTTSRQASLEGSPVRLIL